MKNVQISIVIPTYKRKDLLFKCLKKIEEALLEVHKDRFEVIVSDDDQDLQLEKDLCIYFEKVKYVKGPSKGRSANRNNGASLAQGDWICFIDDDCLPEKNIFKEYSNALSDHENILAFEGAIYPDGNLNQDLIECPVNIHGGAFWSANIMIFKKLFQELGGFDENFVYYGCEDQDLQIRVQKKTSIVFLPQAPVLHPVKKKKIWKEIRKIPNEMESIIYFKNKHSFFRNRVDFLKWWCKTQLLYSYKSFKNKNFGDIMVFLNKLIIGGCSILLDFNKTKH